MGATAFSIREERHCLFGATGVRFRKLLKKTLDLKDGELYLIAEGKRWVVQDVAKTEEWFSLGEQWVRVGVHGLSLTAASGGERVPLSTCGARASLCTIQKDSLKKLQGKKK